jgi:predicted alpha/beta superfamily hydrolase
MSLPLRSASCLGFVIVAGLAVACGSRAVPVPVPEPLPATTFTLSSQGLGEVRRINVYLPPGYGAAGDTRFPVIYMPDGGQEEDFPHVTATVDQLIRAQKVPPLVVVGIENTERRRDMTGPTEVASDREIAPRVGGSAAFRAFIRDELMPVVRERYRTSDDTAIIGESLAGLFIVETFLLEPAMFRRYIALSPSVWWNGEALIAGAAGHVAAAPPGPRALFLASAEEDNIIPGVSRLAETLTTTAPPGLTWTYQPRPDLRHDNIYRSLSATAITWVFATPPSP